LDIIAIAEDNFLITFFISLAVGLLQGSILGRGIRKRFPSFKKHARIVSLTLLTLFSINSIANVIKFAFPSKSSVSSFELPATSEEGFTFALNILGLNAGFGIVIAMMVTVTLILFMRHADIPNIARYFIFALGVIIFLLALIARFTDFVPTLFQILIYAFYQGGVTLGIFLVTKRKETEPPDIK